MNIGVDIDGVLTDLYSFMLEVGPKYFKRDPNNVYGYDFTGMFDVDIVEADKCWKEYLDYYLSLPPRVGAREVINHMHDKGYKIYIITARVDALLNCTKEWLNKFDIYYDDLYNPGDDKRKCIIDKKIDIMIEDNPKNIKDLSKYTKVIAMDAKYNTRITGSNIFRTKTWNEIEKIIDNK